MERARGRRKTTTAKDSPSLVKKEQGRRRHDGEAKSRRLGRGVVARAQHSRAQHSTRLEVMDATGDLLRRKKSSGKRGSCLSIIDRRSKMQLQAAVDRWQPLEDPPACVTNVIVQGLAAASLALVRGCGPLYATFPSGRVSVVPRGRRR